MNKKIVISATTKTMQKLKALSKGRGKGLKNKMEIKTKKLGPKARKNAVVANKGTDIYKNKKTVTSAISNTILKLKVTAKKKEGARGKLAIIAKKLATTAREKESIRSKLAITAKKLAEIARENEKDRDRLAVTAKKLAVTAKEKESVRRRLVVTAKKLDIKAKQLATTAKEKERVRGKLVVTAKQLAATAKEVELANQKLRALDLAKDEFVSIASHQLRTPLTALRGYVGMLLDGDAGPINTKQSEYLTEIKKANDRMINLIMALLNVSRIDLGVFVVEPEPVNLEKVAESTLKESEIRVNDKNLAIITNFGKDLPMINADLNIIRMIFQNLLSNAVKYTPSGGKISLSIKKDDQNILISIADTGCGISKSVQSKIFTKMFRADNARVKDPEGTGLGLYIIKETIEKTGGKIWFESLGENKGATFYVTIPLEGMKKKLGTKRLESK